LNKKKKQIEIKLRYQIEKEILERIERERLQQERIERERIESERLEREMRKNLEREQEKLKKRVQVVKWGYKTTPSFKCDYCGEEWERSGGRSSIYKSTTGKQYGGSFWRSWNTEYDSECCKKGKIKFIQ